MMSPESQSEIFRRLGALEANSAVTMRLTEEMSRRLFGDNDEESGVVGNLKKRLRRLEWYLALAVGAVTAALWIIEKGKGVVVP